jgi:type II secretory pathway predicted ATPase ExeA
MRKFNISGPCDPSLHYIVMREALMLEAEKKVREGRFLTLFAPRRAGKTTFCKLLLNRLKTDLTTIWLRFENLKTVSKADFYNVLNDELNRAFSKEARLSELTIDGPISLKAFFKKTSNQVKKCVLVIDQFEAFPDSVFNELIQTFRQLSDQKEDSLLTSVILVGMNTLTKSVFSEASPFKINEALQMPYFTFEEVRLLIKQYICESKQSFEEKVIKAIYENTQGEPGLVGRLCAELVENLARNRRMPVMLEHYYQAQQYFIREGFDLDIINIVQKQERLMWLVLFENKMLPFRGDDPDIACLSANGIVENREGNMVIPIPLYAKGLINAFRPVMAGERAYYPDETMSESGDFNLNALLKAYCAYVRRRGFLAFETMPVKAGACYYSLEAFLSFFIQGLGGQTYIERPPGRGGINILIRYQGHSSLIENKLYCDETDFKKGKEELANFLISEAMSEGYYLVFSPKHTEKETLNYKEVIEGKQIETHIIPIPFEE